MINFNQCSLGLEFIFSSINNQTMTLGIQIEDQYQEFTPNTDQKINCQFTINLPTKIELFLLGKNMNTDTILNENDQIIKDKHIKLSNLTLDQIQAPLAYLENKGIIFKTNDQKLVTNYFGFNGVATIQLIKTNVFHQQCYFITSISP